MQTQTILNLKQIPVKKRRKEIDDSLIGKLYTMFPYGINDQIDSMENKSSEYNCVCDSFTIKVLYKLPGNGRLGLNSPKSKVDPSVTKKRKEFDDSLIRKSYTI